MTTNFLLGFDTEAPYGKYAQTKEGQKIMEATINTVLKINSVLGSYGISRTYFLSGMFLEACEQVYDISSVQQIFDSISHQVDIQQHAYSHSVFRRISLRPDKVSLTPKRVYGEILKTDQIISRTFGLKTIGIRSPLGYVDGLGEDSELIAKVKEAGMVYISSDLRDKKEGLCPSLVEDNQLRQPRKYDNGLIEIPSHGWQDTAFSGSKSESGLDFRNWIKSQIDGFIISHYTGLLEEAKQKSAELGRDISIGGCFHPQAMYVYDRNLDLFKRTIDFALNENIRITSYSQLAKEII